ncbi:MAG: ABC transporter ATP-binding protein/permease [Christensenellaceae bacterium]|jgi:ATP-binding cassette subfamily B protein|nr:ABC transporter ATP-binding protein/permease [Christensenellaceae bacterium]
MNEDKKSKSGISRLWEIAMGKRPLVILSLILSSISAILGFVPYVFIYLIIKGIIENIAGGAVAVSTLITYGWLAFAGVAGCAIVHFLTLVASHIAAYGTLYNLQMNFAAHLARIPLGFHILAGSGKLRKIMESDTLKTETFIGHQLPDFVSAIVSLIVMLAFSFVFDWRFGLAILTSIVLGMVMMLRMYGGGKMKESMTIYQKSIEDVSNGCVEYVRGMSVVKAFKQTAHSFGRLRSAIRTYTDYVIKYTLGMESDYSASLAIVNNAFIFCMPVGVIIAMTTSNPILLVTNIMFYLVFSQLINGVLQKAVYASGLVMQLAGCVDRMDQVLAVPQLPQVEIAEHINKYDLEFDNVTFSYATEFEGAENALSDVTFIANAGETTAIIGPSGCGKSSTAHLIMHFFDVTSGMIKVGGVDIKNIESAELMKNISFVSQDVFLFNLSVKENIRLGNPDATDDQIVDAAKAAQCHDFIISLPNGYNTMVGVDGIHFSMGERQRISIARAIIKNAPIIVLDEATSFADPENEHLIQKAFEKLMQNKTVIMIAHRLSSVRDADKILVMQEGKIVQSGKHEDLIATKGRYADMWKIFTQAAKWHITEDAEVVECLN